MGGQVKIRTATHDDGGAILLMAEKAYRAAAHEKQLGPFDRDATSRVIAALIEISDGDVLVADGADGPVGMIAVSLAPMLLAPAYRLAREITWWVDPRKRENGVGNALLDAAMAWAKEHGAQDLWMSSPKATQEIAHLCVKRGFRLMESTYVKGV